MIPGRRCAGERLSSARSQSFCTVTWRDLSRKSESAACCLENGLKFGAGAEATFVWRNVHWQVHQIVLLAQRTRSDCQLSWNTWTFDCLCKLNHEGCQVFECIWEISILYSSILYIKLSVSVVIGRWPKRPVIARFQGVNLVTRRPTYHPNSMCLDTPNTAGHGSSRRPLLLEFRAATGPACWWFWGPPRNPAWSR